MHTTSPEVWAQIRYEYENTDRSVSDICFAHGITPNTLRDRRRRWGWAQRRAAIPLEGPPAVVVARTDPIAAIQSPHIDTAEYPAMGPRQSLSSGRASRGPGGGDDTVGSLSQIDPQNADSEPSPHIIERWPATAPPDTRPLHERLQGAVTRVLPALEATLATLAAGPMQPRQMEQAARALGSLTRTLRELNGLLGQHPAQPIDNDPPPEDMDDFRNELARRLENVIASRDAQIPAAYEAAWEEFATEGKRR